MGVRDGRVVLFDLGGVLLPFEQDRRIDALVAALAIDAASARALVASGIAERLDTGAANDADLAAAMSRAAGRPVGPAEARRLWLSVFTEPNLALWDLAADLGRRGPIGILSDNPVFVSEAFPCAIGWDHVFLSAELGVMKPAAGVFDAVRQALAAAPERITFIDDRESNVQAARDAGWDAIVYTSNLQLAADLAQRGLR